jgi:hypothetical protein
VLSSTVYVTTAGRVDWPCILGSPAFSTEITAAVSEGEYCSTLKSGAASLEIEKDGIEGWSVSVIEALDLPLSSLVVTRESDAVLRVLS